MHATHDHWFNCPACDARYAWLPQQAGRKVRCHCGSVLRIAAQPGLPPELLEVAVTDKPASMSHRTPSPPTGGYVVELETQPDATGTPGTPRAAAHQHLRRCDQCGQKVALHAVVCTRCGQPLPTSHDGDDTPASQAALPAVSAFIEPVASPAMPIDHRQAHAQATLEQVRRRYDYARSVEEEVSAAARLAHVILPGVLIALGSAMLLTHALLYQPVGMPAALPFWAKLLTHILSVTVNVVFLFFGLLLVAKLFGNAVGTLMITLWRLLALAVFCVGTDTMVIWGIDIITEGMAWLGSYVRLALLAAVFFPLASVMLGLEILETVVLFLFSRMVPLFVAFFVVMIVYSMFE